MTTPIHLARPSAAVQESKMEQPEDYLVPTVPKMTKGRWLIAAVFASLFLYGLVFAGVIYDAVRFGARFWVAYSGGAALVLGIIGLLCCFALWSFGDDE